MDFNRPRRDILFLRILSLLSLQLYIRYTEKIDRFDYDICFNVAFQKITKKEKSENNRGGYHARQIVVPYLRIAILHHSTISSSFYRSLSLSLPFIRQTVQLRFDGIVFEELFFQFHPVYFRGKQWSRCSRNQFSRSLKSPRFDSMIPGLIIDYSGIVFSSEIR